MEGFSYTPKFNVALIISILVIARPVQCQISTPCSASMFQSFTPCMNFITNSTDSSASPTAGCCDALKSLMGSGLDCLCLLVTGGVPLHIPINNNLAISLPRACHISGVPIECNATAAPIPAPGPISSESPMSPTGFGPQSPSGQPWPNAPAETPPGPPSDDGPSNTPAAVTPEADIFPTTPPGVRPDLSFAPSCKWLPHYLLVASLGAIAFNVFLM